MANCIFNVSVTHSTVVPADARLRTGFRILLLAATLCAALLASRSVSAEPLEDYFALNEQLEQLLTEREALEASISTAAAAEHAALERFGEVESKLAPLVADGRLNEAWRADVARRLAEAEAQVPALDEQAAQLEERIRAQDRWLNDSMAPQVFGAAGYVAALAEREQLPSERAAALRAVGAIRVEQAGAVLDQGRLNTEITFWERQADALSRQVGALRARALAANARLVEVQKTGLELTATAQDQMDALRRLGYPIGASLVAEGPPPVPEPLQWPSAAPRGYVLPAGASALALRAGEPLVGNRSQLPASALAALPPEPWKLPVDGMVTTPFGDATPYQPAHWAVDLGARLYEPVRAAAEGVVEFAGLAAGDNRLASYGMVVVLRHGEHLTSLYAHLDDRAYGAAVRPGEAVQQGQVIGYVGLTGNSTGPHVHFETRLDGQPIDPLVLANP